MASKIRLMYLRTVLHQPISYFDKNAPGSIAVSLANDTNLVQVGLSEKLSIVCQVLSMILTAFVISFTRGWKLTLVVATIVPYMVVSTGFFGGLSTQAEGKVQETLSTAAGVAEEALSSILNITALGASEKIVGRFDVYLKDAMKSFRRIGPLQACIYGNSEFSAPRGICHANICSVLLRLLCLCAFALLWSEASESERDQRRICRHVC